MRRGGSSQEGKKLYELSFAQLFLQAVKYASQSLRPQAQIKF